MKKFKTVLLLLSFFYSLSVIAGELGTNITLPLIAKDPPNLHGYRLSIWYLPDALTWDRFNVYIDTSVGHWWINGDEPNRELNIIAIVPVLRAYIQQTPTFSPYVEMSVGPSYLSRTRIDNRNLGMHYSFQDELAIGAAMGKEKRLSMSLSAMHYSNGSLSAHNSGITIPLLINISYRL